MAAQAFQALSLNPPSPGGTSHDIESIVGGLLDVATQQHAVAQLATMVDEVEGVQAAQLGRNIRDFGALPELLGMLGRMETRQDALRVIGNLASDAVDLNARETKQMIYDLNGFHQVLPLIWADDELTLVYALGAVQNLCTYPEYAHLMQTNGSRERLEELITLPGSKQRQHFATGCLNNMRVIGNLKPMATPRGGVPSRPPDGQQQPQAPPPRPNYRAAPVPVGPPRALRRFPVPPDNSCLFASCALLCELISQGEQLTNATFNLRAMCAEDVRADPDQPHRLALLGVRSADEYASYIQDERHWGGESEIVIIARHYSVEVVVASCESLRLLRYPPAAAARGTVYLLYTGQHYDPLIGPEPYDTRLFTDDAPKGVAEREEAAIKIAIEHRETAEKERASREANFVPAVPTDGTTDYSTIPGFV